MLVLLAHLALAPSRAPEPPAAAAAPAHERPARRDGAWTLRRNPGTALPPQRQLPPLPSGERLDLLEDQGISAGVGGRVWRAASLLCHWMRSEAESIKGSSVIELGAGIGSCGLYAAGLGASRVLITDGSRGCCSLIRENSERNMGIISKADAEVEVAELLFESKPPVSSFDWIIGSDITYRIVSQDALCSLVKRMLSATTGSRCILAHEHRRNVKGDAKESYNSDTSLSHTSEADPHELMKWEVNDVHMEMFIEAAGRNGLDVIPLLTQRGGFASDSMPMEVVNDVSIFELAPTN